MAIHHVASALEAFQELLDGGFGHGRVALSGAEWDHEISLSHEQVFFSNNKCFQKSRYIGHMGFSGFLGNCHVLRPSWDSERMDYQEFLKVQNFYFHTHLLKKCFTYNTHARGTFIFYFYAILDLK